MLNQKIEEEIEEAAVKREEERENGNDNFEGEKEHSIRKKNIEALHREMDQAVDKRKHRLDYAVKLRDTNTQWDLIAAAVEEGVIAFFKLQAGRSLATGTAWAGLCLIHHHQCRSQQQQQ